MAEELSLRVLVVDDDVELLETIADILSQAGFQVAKATNVNEAIQVWERFSPEVVTLDQAMPGTWGTDLVKIVRERVDWAKTPILMLTAFAEEEAKVRAFELGVDDYLTKPFSAKELVARLKALVRRSRVAKGKDLPSRLRVDDLILERETRRLWFAGQEWLLTPTEFGLLYELLMNKGEPVKREVLKEKVLLHEKAGPRTVDVHILYLRNKLGDALGRRIQSVRGLGYRYYSPQRGKKSTATRDSLSLSHSKAPESLAAKSEGDKERN